jgi:hypothetical protein
MMMDEKEIRSFLVKQPRGTKILVRTVDDEVHELSSPDGKGTTWAHVAASVVALVPALIEIHDAENKLVRATRCTDVVTPSAEAGLPVLHTDPETARLTHFANLLYRATEFSTTLAFTKMVEMFGMVNDRSMALEQRLERTEANYRREMQTRLDEAFERAEDLAEQAETLVKEGAPGDPLTEFAKGFLQARAGAPPPPPPNGKAVKQ